MKFQLFFLAVFIGLCSAHDEYHGSCPVLTPMGPSNGKFNWDKVSLFYRDLIHECELGPGRGDFLKNGTKLTPHPHIEKI